MNDLTQLTDKELQAEIARRVEQREDDRKAYKQLVNDELIEIIEPLKLLSNQISKTKLFIFESLKTLLELKNKAYDVKSTQQSHTFSDSKGNSIIYGFRINDDWDDTVNAGIEKVREFIQSLAKDEDTAKLVHAINQLLKKDAKGNLKASRVLELTKLAEEFNDENFTDAVEIIRKSYKPSRSAFFIDASVTDAQGKKVNLPLSMTSADFPKDADVESLFPVHEKYGI